MKMSTYKEIIDLPAEKLYEKALEYKSKEDYNNYSIHMVMAANKDHELAKECFIDDSINDVNLEQDHNITRPFYEETQSYSYSCVYLAYMYRRGKGVKKNIPKAIELYELAFSKGNSNAACELATIYEYGEYKNVNRQIELYQIAIEKHNNVDAMNLLAIMYIDGEYIERNVPKAIELL